MSNNHLTTKALIVNLSIGAWSGRKHDKKVTREVEENHSAQQGEAGRFNKMLTGKEFLAGITKAGGAARQFLYENTLPWGTNGDMLLASANYLTFVDEMGRLQNNYFSEVDKAEQLFDEELRKAAIRLNGMFNPNDYPNSKEFRSKFSFNVSFMPIPEIADFRIDLNQTEVNLLTKSIENEFTNRINNAVRDIWQRIKDQLTHMKETLGDKDKIFRDSLFSNLADIINLMPKLNVTNDSAINDICIEMQSLLVNPEAVRQNSVMRSNKAQEVSELLKKFDSFFS